MASNTGRSLTAEILHALPAGDTCITRGEIAALVGRPSPELARRIMVLLNQGFIECLRPGCYRLAEAGRRARDGNVRHLRRGARPASRRDAPPRRLKPRTIADKVWKLLRMQTGKLTLGDLMSLMSAGTSPEAVRPYLRALASAGYLGRFRGSGSRPDRYVLLRNTGPETPRVDEVAGRVWDTNQERFYP